MFNIIIIAAIVLAWLAFVGGYLRFDRDRLAEQVTKLAGGALVVVAIFLAVIGRELAAVATALVGLTIMGAAPDAIASVGYMMGRRVRGTLGMFGFSRTSSGPRSTVRSAALEVEVDKSTGIIGGRVLAGRFEGRSLVRLSLDELAALRREISLDGESQALLDAYLDRREPRWRENVKFDAAFRQSRAASSGAMSQEEAHQVLGLKPGAGEAEVREAHRRLIKAVHPDVGGSAFLAAKINEAKDRLIGKHRARSGH